MKIKTLIMREIEEITQNKSLIQPIFSITTDMLILTRQVPKMMTESFPSRLYKIQENEWRSQFSVGLVVSL